MIHRSLPPVLALVLASAPALGAQQDTARAVPLDTLRVLGAPVPAQRAPFGVSVVREVEIRAGRPGLALTEALAAVPGVQVDNRFNYALGERISVRGFGARAQFGVRGVRVLVDGIPATLPDGQTTLNHVDPATLGRAEIIRGPASALYGNASGGVIQLSSAPAPAAPLASEHRVLAGANGLLRAETSVGGRMGAASYRAYASRLEYAGYRTHSSAENLNAGGTFFLTRGADELRLSVTAVRYDALNPGSLSDSLLRVDRSAAFARNVAQHTGETGRQGQAGAWYRRAMGPGALEVAAYGLMRSIDNPIPNAVIDLDRRVGGLRAAWTADAGPLAWTAGGALETQRDDRLNFANEAGQRGARTLDQAEGVTSSSAFAQGTAALSGGWEAMGALRYDRFRFSVRDRLTAGGNPDDSGARTMDRWSPALGVSWTAVPAVSFYANVATAFETPTTTELANRPTGAGGFNPELQPQRTVSVEAGAKARLAPWAWLEGAAYRARIDDALVPFEVEGAPGRVFYRNAGTARHRGVEAAAVLTPRPAWTARAAYTWTDARFGEYVLDGEDLGGNRVPGIAPHRLDLSILAMPSRGPFAGVDVRRVSATPVADDDAAGRFDSPGYTLVDLRGGWEGLRTGRAALSPFVGVGNLLDRAYNTSVVINAFGGRFYEPGPGRTFYAGARLTLGAPAER
ncbi:TonB-dependent receptor [Longimicrobium sp.]|uniref:TonB-dependent receptor family protein n=1 Tax=Longimicrobium sp. TaxID=2029185 RepID=UPI002E311376|nr:TonB-dependent receptor [Longimicrobium sp.]HEX6042394.1 TonB-dependent receptor [Longimicrobium sp.]